MDSVRWKRVETLFEAALEQPAEKWHAFLVQACPGDAALVEEVESLLASHATANKLLDSDLPGRARGGADRALLALLKDSAASALTPGSTFGPYQIVRLLGTGGMGEVYLARDSRLQREVALKLLGVGLDFDSRMVERFRQEALAVSALRHPHIPVVFEAGIHDGRHFIASECIDGQPLSERLRAGPLEWRTAAAIAETLARALQTAHAAGIVHRDVKPGNIMLDREGRPHLLDFGIAKFIRPLPAVRTGDASLTRAGVQMGTPGYMAPEQVDADTDTVGPAADLWSLAAVLYEMLTGHRPQAGTDDTAKHRIPRPLAPILERALQREPGRRFRDASALAEALAAAQRQETVRLPGAPRRVALVAIAMAVLVGLGVWRANVPSPWMDRMSAVPSLAVLPFENLSADKDDDYFAAGLEDELLTRLSHVSGLRVLDRHATDAVGNRPGDLVALAQRLGVEHFLAGSVQRRDGQVLVHIRLIDPASRTQRWAERYEREAAAVFSIERDVAESVALHLNAELHPDERVTVAVADTRDPAAHESALRGRALYRHGDEASLRAAVAAFEHAITLDPNYAQAYADLAMARYNLDSFLPIGGAENRRQSLAAARRSIALDPRLPDGYVALGWDLAFYEWDLADARQAFERAEQLAPNSPRVVNGLATLSTDFGDFARAQKLYERALLLDPVSATSKCNLANLFLAMGNADSAERLYREALRLEPALGNAHFGLALIALDRGQIERARTEAQAEPLADWRDFALARIAQSSGDHGDSALHAFIQHYGENDPFLVAALYAAHSDPDQAFAWLERAKKSQDTGAMEILEAVEFKPYQRDPRFTAFCRALGILDAKHADGQARLGLS